jgi:hypothetical protein
MLQVALLGQTELDELLDREHLRQFKQRIALRLTIEPLSGADIEQYIRFRWSKAGGKNLPFSTAGISCIAQMSQGIPRVINVVCDNALMQAFAEGAAVVEEHHVLRVCVDLRLSKISSRQQIPAAPVYVPGYVPPAAAAERHPLKALERYNTAAAKPSLLARIAGKLRLAQRIETT